MEQRIHTLISYKYPRFKTREVKIGDVPLGDNNPVRVQSMTTTDTMDTKATVEQSIRMIEAGCEYVRITAPSKLEAQNLTEIKKELRKRGYKTPLIADIHFTPNAAEIAARIVEKVRVNPGNYADKKKFETIDYTDASYEAELGRIRQKFIPLVKICKEYGTAMRIGTNHGSLSDRIMSRFGDTPLGMVESALEFVRICEEFNYYDIVLSMKSSNPGVMVQAYRLLTAKMIEKGMNYPLHLGVTEAGGGEDGRIKSALGIGTLLEEGLGDTIRVSLTEDPEYEIPVAYELVNRYKEIDKNITTVYRQLSSEETYKRRKTKEAGNIGGTNVPVVFADFSNKKGFIHHDLKAIGYSYEPDTDKWNLSDGAADYIYLGSETTVFELPLSLKKVYDYNYWITLKDRYSSFPLLTSEEYLNSVDRSTVLNFVHINASSISKAFLNKISSDTAVAIIININDDPGTAGLKNVFNELIRSGNEIPIILKRTFRNLTLEQLILYSSIDTGSLFIDGFGDGIWIKVENLVQVPERDKTLSVFSKRESIEKFINRLQFGILQAARVRISKTEYIACPSCGRTLFDLQETTEMIRSRTEHLKGLKIAVMGCIVNGPGEMADADYGYVGSGVGKITLYKGKDIVKRNIPADGAVDELICIIKEDGNWRNAG